MHLRSSGRTRAAAWSLVAAVLLLPAPLVLAEEGQPSEGRLAAEEVAPREDCCFTNRSFTGVCRVKPTEEETCATILAYLNNPQSRGKTYCGSTTIRGGWAEVACEAPQSGGPVESR